MPPFRQSLEGVKDDGTLVGKGGRTKKLGAAATRRLASRTTDTAVSKPVERAPRPPNTGGDRERDPGMDANAGRSFAPPVPAWKQLADKGIGGQGSAAANKAKLAGFQVGPPPPGDGSVSTDAAMPPPSPAAGVSGASPEILQRMEQLAVERGVGGAKPMAGPPPPPGEGIPPEVLQQIQARLGGGIPGFQMPPGVASTLPATLEAPGAPGPVPPAPAPGMTKPMLGARPPVGGTAAPPGGTYDGLANIGAALRRRNPMAGLGGGSGAGPGGREMMR